MNISTILDARVVSEKPFTRAAGTNRVTKIRVADNPSRKSDRNPCRFLNAEGWGVVGDQLAKLSKGDVVSLTGELKLDKYEDKNKQERIDDVIVVTAFRVQKSESFFSGGGGAGTSTKEAPADPEFSPVPDDSDIPF